MPIIDEQYLNDLKRRLAQTDNTPDQSIESFHATDKAYKKILRLVSVRERSVEELRKRLSQEDFEEAAINQALTRALDCALLDDTRFAESLIRSYLSSGKGSYGIELKLEEHKIDISCLGELQKELIPSEDEELQRAFALLKRRPPQSKNKRDGAYRKLVLNGFSSSIAGDAAKTWSESINPKNDF